MAEPIDSEWAMVAYLSDGETTKGEEASTNW
jgi:hypothetical protein